MIGGADEIQRIDPYRNAGLALLRRKVNGLLIPFRSEQFLDHDQFKKRTRKTFRDDFPPLR